MSTNDLEQFVAETLAGHEEYEQKLKKFNTILKTLQKEKKFTYLTYEIKSNL